MSSSYTLSSQVVGMSAAAASKNGSTLAGVWGADFKLGALVQGLKTVQGDSRQSCHPLLRVIRVKMRIPVCTRGQGSAGLY